MITSRQAAEEMGQTERHVRRLLKLLKAVKETFTSEPSTTLATDKTRRPPRGRALLRYLRSTGFAHH